MDRSSYWKWNFSSLCYLKLSGRTSLPSSASQGHTRQEYPLYHSTCSTYFHYIHSLYTYIYIYFYFLYPLMSELTTHETGLSGWKSSFILFSYLTIFRSTFMYWALYNGYRNADFLYISLYIYPLYTSLYTSGVPMYNKKISEVYT